jgi:hypothetical protein
MWSKTEPSDIHPGGMELNQGAQFIGECGTAGRQPLRRSA